MKQLFLFSTLIFSLVFSHTLSAQVLVRSIDAEQVDRFRKIQRSVNVPKKVLPQINIQKLLQEDQKDVGVPPRFGKAITAGFSLENSGVWIEEAGGRMWTLQIESQGAYSLNFIFDQFRLAEGAELLIYNTEKNMIMGPITHEQNSENGRFATDVISGSSVIIELFEPASTKEKSNLHIQKVIHGYKDILKKEKPGEVTTQGFGDAENCHNNVDCAVGNDWQDESDAVAMVITDAGQRICSGSLITTACYDFQPNFLTAFHCIDLNENGSLSSGEINDAEDWVFRFQYKSRSCNTNLEPFTNIYYSGSTFKAAWRNTDFALLELNQLPNGSHGI